MAGRTLRRCLGPDMLYWNVTSCSTERPAHVQSRCHFGGDAAAKPSRIENSKLSTSLSSLRQKIAFVTAPNWLNSSCSGSHRRLVCCPTCICTSKSLTHKSSCVKSCGMPPTKTFRTWYKFDHKHERTDLGREGVSLRRWDCPVPLKVLHTHGNGKTRALSSIAY